MSCERLDVAERATHGADLLRRVRDEGATSRVLRATCQSEVGIPARKHVDDSLWRRARCALGAYDVRGRDVEVVAGYTETDSTIDYFASRLLASA